MKELDSEVARQAEVNQPTQPNPNPNHDRTGRSVVTEQMSRSSAQEIDTRCSRDCKNTSLFVKRLDKDKDTDKNVDANHDRMGRPVVTEQTSRSSAQEIDTRCSRDCKNTSLFVKRLDKDKDTDKNVDADHDRMGRPVVTEQTSRSSAQEIDKRCSRDCKNTSLFVERWDEDKDTDKNVDADHDRTGRPVVIGQPTGSSTPFNDVDIDFRVSGLPDGFVKQVGNSRVRELVKKIENHPRRQALQADLQNNNAYKPFSEKSKKMNKDMGNVELFELCETIPKVQCKECLLYWNQGIVYCTCGHLLRENQSSRRIHRWHFNLLSLPNYDIKKGRPHDNRHGKTEVQIKHYIAHDLRKRCIEKNYEGIHDRFQKDLTFRDSQLRIDRTEEVCIQMDKDAQKDFTYRMSQNEYFRYNSTHLDAMNRWNSDQTSAKH